MISELVLQMMPTPKPPNKPNKLTPFWGLASMLCDGEKQDPLNEKVSDLHPPWFAPKSLGGKQNFCS